MDRPELRELSIDSLIIDPKLQRTLDRRRVKKIADDYDPEAVGVLTVSRRADGTYHIMDGQHRHAAARLVGVEKLMCRVFTGLSLAEEAKLFRLLNTTAKPTNIDLFKIRVVEGDPVAVDVSRIVGKHGWDVELSNSRAAFAATAAAERVYRQDPAALEKAVSTVTRAWGHGRESVDNRIVEGVGLFFVRYGNTVDIDELIDKLSRFPGGAGALIGRARGLQNIIGSKVAQSLAEVVVELYNKGRRTRALPPWRAS